MSFRPGVRLALDWGDARIGVAACDPGGTLAFPVGVVPSGPDELPGIADVVAEYAPVEVLVGLPRSLSGGEGPAATRMRERASQLARVLGPSVPVRLVDERFSTVSASRQLSVAGRPAKQQRSRIDAAAAATILEHALETEKSRGCPPGELVSAADQPT